MRIPPRVGILIPAGGRTASVGDGCTAALVGLGVEVGTKVEVGFGVEVGTRVFVGLGVEDGFGVDVGVEVGVKDGPPGVTVGPGVLVGVGVGVRVGVDEGPPVGVNVGDSGVKVFLQPGRGVISGIFSSAFGLDSGTLGATGRVPSCLTRKAIKIEIVAKTMVEAIILIKITFFFILFFLISQYLNISFTSILHRS